MKTLSHVFVLAFLFSVKLSAHTDGDSLWNRAVIHDVHLDFSQTDYWDSLTNNYTSGTYMQCTLTLDGRQMMVGAKFKGNSSYNNPSNKKPFKIDLNTYVNSQDYDGIRKFELNNGFKDPTFLREKLSLDFLNAHGIAAPRCAFARVYLNNVYWGLYTLVEVVDSKFLVQHYGEHAGNLFKADPSGDFRWYGSTDALYYTHYELHTNTTQNDWSDLVQLIDKINNTPTANFFDSLETVCETWSAVKYLAYCNIFDNLDSYVGSGHNFYLYDDSLNFSGKFHFIVWDVNESFGEFQLGMTISQLESLSYTYLNMSSARPLAAKMFADATYHSMYISEMCDLLHDFNNTNLDPQIDSLANAIRPDVYADTLKFYTNADFDNNLTSDINVPGNPGSPWIPGLKSFITARNASLASQLQPYGCWLSVQLQNENDVLAVFPNPVQNSATLSLPSGWNAATSTVQIYDVTGRLVFSSSLKAGLVIETSTFDNGIFIVQVNSCNGKIVREKMIVNH